MQLPRALAAVRRRKATAPAAEQKEGAPRQWEGLPRQREGLPKQWEGLPRQREKLPVAVKSLWAVSPAVGQQGERPVAVRSCPEVVLLHLTTQTHWSKACFPQTPRS